MTTKKTEFLFPDEPLPNETVREIRSYLNQPYRDLPFHFFESVGSTNDCARDLASNRAPYGSIVLAHDQYSAKGRMGRSFSCMPGGGIYLTMLLEPKFDFDHSVLITTAAAVAIVNAIEKVCGAKPEIKWVNDIYLDGKKICGILAEAIADFQSNRLQYVILGIGINCDPEAIPPELRDTAGILPGEFSRNRLTAEIINQIMSINENLTDRTFVETYRSHSMMDDRDILVFKGGYREEAAGVPAHVLGIDENGGLMIRYSDGREETLTSGEVSIRLDD